jgi:tricarballylate dehydrogenase
MDADVIVVGAGNAGMCAALQARELGADVLLLEKSAKGAARGNSFFTGGSYRFAYDGAEDIKSLVDDLSEDSLSRTDFRSYTKDEFLSDLGRLTEYRTDLELAEILVDDSLDGVKWLVSHGVRFIPAYSRHALGNEGKFTFSQGMCLEVAGGGEALVSQLQSACDEAGVRTVYGFRATSLVRENGAIGGVSGLLMDDERKFGGRSVVLATGGFESSAELRSRYLGPGWELAKVRGSRHNTGDGILMALRAGALSYGHWSGCHAVAWDAMAPDFGDPRMGELYQRHSYPLGITVNRRGERFFDEGSDFRLYTYAALGRQILQQPGQIAWQIFDSKTADILQPYYRLKGAARTQGSSVAELAGKLAASDDVDAENLVSTIAAFNAAVNQGVPFNPDIKDGRRTIGLDIPKSNWALTLEVPPFSAYPVTTGITFTFGGVRVDKDAGVLHESGERIRGLYSCGEMVGGLFYWNYPGGSGLCSGTVFGRRAGSAAARESRHR